MTDPNAILAGLGKEQAAFLPLGGAGEILGGHKGYGLGTMVEILCASLQSGAFLWGLSGLDANGKPQPFKVGHFFMAINIENFVPLEEFKKTTGQILRDLRNSTKARDSREFTPRVKKNTRRKKSPGRNVYRLFPTCKKRSSTFKKN